MSDKRDNLDKIGTYSTISLPFELNAEQLSKLPPGKELHFDRAKQTVRGADYCYAVSRACYRTERSRSVIIASKTLGKIFTDDPEQNVYRNRPRNWKQLAQIQAAEAAVKEAKTHQEPTGTGVYSVQGILGMLESAIEFRDDGTSFPTIVKVPASVLLLVCVFSATRGEFNARQAADYWNANLGELQRLFPAFHLEEVSSDTIRRMLRSLSDETLKTVLKNVAGNLTGDRPGLRQIALDGQAARASRHIDTDRIIFHMNMVDCSNMRIMAHEQIDTKSNEIKAGPKLVSQFNLNGAIVSADALNTVVELAEAILKQGGHYFLAAKGNKGFLFDDIEELFSNALRNMEIQSRMSSRDINGHGRKGYHQTFVLPGNMLDKKYLRKWPSLAEGCLVKNISFLTETKTGETTREERYFITSYPYSANGGPIEQSTVELMAQCVTSHWYVESTHWHLDLNFKQDAFQCQDPYYLFAATTVIKVALNLVKAFQEHEQASKNLKRARSVERCLKEFAPTLAIGVKNCEGLGGEWANVD